MEKPRTTYGDVRASVWFLEKDELYATVKPYALAFTPAAQIPRENIRRKEVLLAISDLRGSEHMFTLNRNGFVVLRFHNQHDNIDWDNEMRVKELHYLKIVSVIQGVFPGARYMVRSSAEQLIQDRLGQQASEILRGKYLVANVWHPLKGPNQDWPLALCDVSSLDPQRDLEIADYVTETTNRENCLAYTHANHRWWYLSNQEATEAYMFCQYDSERGIKSGRGLEQSHYRTKHRICG
ncbi:MAG: hypothetical protein Q9196_002904 [Gyalolechia fulgens]